MAKFESQSLMFVVKFSDKFCDILLSMILLLVGENSSAKSLNQLDLILDLIERRKPIGMLEQARNDDCSRKSVARRASQATASNKQAKASAHNKGSSLAVRSVAGWRPLSMAKVLWASPAASRQVSLFFKGGFWREFWFGGNERGSGPALHFLSLVGERGKEPVKSDRNWD